jgi:hypothetical protein
MRSCGLVGLLLLVLAGACGILTAGESVAATRSHPPSLLLSWQKGAICCGNCREIHLFLGEL